MESCERAAFLVTLLLRLVLLIQLYTTCSTLFKKTKKKKQTQKPESVFVYLKATPHGMQ